MRTVLRLIPLGLSLSLAFLAFGQGVVVEVDDVTDNRVTAEMLRGSLDLRLRLSGAELEDATAARVIVKEARDDRGTVLTKGDANQPDFQGREYNAGTVMLSLLSPARGASSVLIKGNVEIFAPSRDPNAMVRIDKALTKLDTPLASKTLQAAKIELTPLSAARYEAMLKDREVTEEMIAAMRAEGKKAGASEKEIELAIGLAQALGGMDAPPREGTVLLAGKRSSFDQIFRIDVLGADGEPMDTPERGSSTRGYDTIMTIVPREPPAADAALQITLLTAKSRLSIPFELTLELP
ncbi:MAG TPA: hypothetical protein VF701_16430 [Thermoanaerobaculia bacterium]